MSETASLALCDPFELPESEPLVAGIDHVELYTGNARQAAYYYSGVFGFTPVAISDLSKGPRDRLSIALVQGNIRLLITSPVSPDGEIAHDLAEHGEGVKNIAFRVHDVAEVFDHAVRHGAKPVSEPAINKDPYGLVLSASVAGCGNVVHSFIQRDSYFGDFLPGYLDLSPSSPVPSLGLTAIDHVAISVSCGELDQSCDFYQRVFGFFESHAEDVSTEYSAMTSKVVQNSTGTVKFPIVCPAAGKRKSQVEEFLLNHRGPGVQHLAFLSDDIFESVRLLRANGVSFLDIPASYYEAVESRLGAVPENLSRLQELGILIDRGDEGYLLQMFTQHIPSRPTLFVELIQRKGANGFGGGNIRALFEAVEREQARRGNL